MIHETQQVFRTLVHLNSYVGERERLASIPFSGPISRGIYLLAATLLDQEVSFATLGMDDINEVYLQQEFRSPSVTVAEADFILVGKNIRSEQIAELNRAKIGDLIDPQKSATIIVELASFLDEGNYYQLAGPGIEGSRTIELPKELTELLTIREKLNQEYPLGVDVIVIDEQLETLCIPRTTAIREVA